MFVRSSSRRLAPGWLARSLATHFVGSQNWTWESCSPLMTSKLGQGRGETLS